MALRFKMCRYVVELPWCPVVIAGTAHVLASGAGGPRVALFMARRCYATRGGRRARQMSVPTDALRARSAPRAAPRRTPRRRASPHAIHARCDAGLNRLKKSTSIPPIISVTVHRIRRRREKC
ncbi:hypothetical protein EVAR_37448_1 [Eumeta japonica]|uniref:Uncharacterized protein n=1 Tax=Eumeta variegata TaxID=151549 RepID=A0A4C1X6B8_EUMVA|nr:hypothetical protein EVAR_37448_1 [Eumeta japonica]